MADNYIIEIRSKPLGITVEAGIVVRDGHRFRFYAATHVFDSLEGQLFKSPKAAEAAALRHIVEGSTRGRFDSIDVAHRREYDANSHCSRTECHDALAASGDAPLGAISPNAAPKPRRIRRTTSSKGVVRQTMLDDKMYPRTVADLKSLLRAAQSYRLPLSVHSVGARGRVRALSPTRERAREPCLDRWRSLPRCEILGMFEESARTVVRAFPHGCMSCDSSAHGKA